MKKVELPDKIQGGQLNLISDKQCFNMNVSHSILGTYLNKKLQLVFLTFKFGRISYIHTHTHTHTHTIWQFYQGKLYFTKDL